MTVTAEKIVEAPRTEIAQYTVVTGQARPAKAVVAEPPSVRVRERLYAAPVKSASVAPYPRRRSRALRPRLRLNKTTNPLPLLGLCRLATFRQSLKSADASSVEHSGSQSNRN